MIDFHGHMTTSGFEINNSIDNSISFKSTNYVVI